MTDLSQFYDGFLRPIRYLRLSITALCNFRCDYCLPNGSSKVDKNELTLEEIQTLVKAAVELGIEKIRITGGEPSLRADLVEIIRSCKALGVKEVALTTNG